MENVVIQKVGGIKFEIDIIEMKELIGRPIARENYQDLDDGLGEKMTIQTRRTLKVEDEEAEEEEVVGLLAVSSSFSGPGGLLKTSIPFQCDTLILYSYHDIHNNLSALPYFLCTAGAGAAIAPPPSLTESSEPPSGQDNDEGSGNKSRNASRGLDVAAKIMAKYGYKVSSVSYATSLEFTSSKSGVLKTYDINCYSSSSNGSFFPLLFKPPNLLIPK